MILVVDNFLDNEMFDILNASMLSKIDTAKSRLAYDVGNEKAYSLTFNGLHGDILLPSMHLGVHIGPIIDKVRNYIETKIGKSIPDVESTHYAFMNQGYIIRRHVDAIKFPVNGTGLKKNFKAFIFGHARWEEDWGGHLCFKSDGSENLPLPNRLVVYTVDEPHGTILMNEKSGDATRMIMGIRFGFGDEFKITGNKQ